MIERRRATFEGSEGNSSVWTRLAASSQFSFSLFSLAGWVGGIPNRKVPRATKLSLLRTPPQLQRRNVFPKTTFHWRTLARLLGDLLGVYSFCSRLNSLGCFKPVLLFPFFFGRVGGRDTEPKSTQSHQTFITSYASATPKEERVPKNNVSLENSCTPPGWPLRSL